MRTIAVVLFLAITGTFFVGLAQPAEAALVVCGRSDQKDDPVYAKCTPCMIIYQIKVIIDFLVLKLAPILATLFIVIAGFMMVLGGANPESISAGKGMLTNVVIGLVIIYSSWMITNFILRSVAGDNNLAQSWFKIECDVTEGSRQRPTVSPKPSSETFNNAASPELASFLSCVQDKLPSGVTATVTSITDSNISKGTCDPSSDDLSQFNNSNACHHTKNSCHYGGRNCQSKGSYAVDYDEEQNFQAISEATLRCNPGRFAEIHNGNHVHVSIGNAYSCGCN